MLVRGNQQLAHMQFKHTLAFTITRIDMHYVLIECDDVLKLHMRPKIMSPKETQ
jgi:hypothetical protein